VLFEALRSLTTSKYNASVLIIRSKLAQQNHESNYLKVLRQQQAQRTQQSLKSNIAATSQQHCGNISTTLRQHLNNEN